MKKIPIIIISIVLIIIFCGFIKNTMTLLSANSQSTKASQEKSDQLIAKIGTDTLYGRQRTIISNSREIINEVLTDSYASWDKIASSQNSTTEELSDIAKKCGQIKKNKYWATKIATSLSENQNSNDHIMNELTKSCYYAVINIAASSNHSKEITLKSAAQICAQMAENEYWANEIANSICNNKNTTDKILDILSKSNFSSVSKLAVSSL